MMDTAYEGQGLQASFTFRIVEAVKRIKIHPMPRMAGLPWGLSIAAGVMLIAMTIGSQVAIHQLSEPLAFPGETMPRIREMPVDILSAPGTSITAGSQGDIDGGGMDPRNPQNTFLLAPAMGGGTWTQKADMPTARYIPGSAVVDGKIYVIGGAPVQFGSTAVVEEYDPAADTWTRRADMPTARQGVAAAAVDGIIYAIGGNEGRRAGGRELSTVEAYDPATDMWTTKADMPAARVFATAAVVDGRIYVIGGMFGETVQDNRALSTVEAYDPATDTWIAKADMPTARYVVAACVIDGRIYVFGGVTAYSGGVSLATVEVYDPATDTWTRAADMPWPRMGHTASVVDGKIYIIGGADNELLPLLAEGKEEAKLAEELFPSIDVYDPGMDTWTTVADRFPNPRLYVTASVVDGKIYTYGGQRGADDIFSILEEYVPGLPGNISAASSAGKLLRTWGEVKSE